MIYTTEEVAALYQVTTRTVQYWITRGKLRAKNTGSARRKIYRITGEALAEFECETELHLPVKKRRKKRVEKLPPGEIEYF